MSITIMTSDDFSVFEDDYHQRVIASPSSRRAKRPLQINLGAKKKVTSSAGRTRSASVTPEHFARDLPSPAASDCGPMTRHHFISPPQISSRQSKQVCAGGHLLPEKELQELTDKERTQILSVIRRDAILQVQVQLKASRLKAELAMLRKRGLLSGNGHLNNLHHHQSSAVNLPSSMVGNFWTVDPSRSCGRCRSELGRIMNRGAFCRSCNVKVCKNCREYGIGRNGASDWLCTICYKSREIQMATGEWIHDYLNRSGNGVKRNKSVNNGQRLFIAGQQQHGPPTAHVESKKQIKRSWTISNPSGTQGPQMRSNHSNAFYQSGETFTTSKPGVHDDNIPPPKIAPPVFLSVPPAPPPVPTAPPSNRGRPGPPFIPRRNVPVRSHSMSIADVNRFYGSPPLPRFRPPPPPTQQKTAGHNAKAGVEITELADSGSDNNEEEVRKTKPKKHFIHHNNQVIVEDLPNNADLDFSTRKYMTLDPTNRVRAHEMQPGNFSSLERATRRKLPTVPNTARNALNTQSLPRPSKNHAREQSDSRSRDRLDKLRSQSFDEEAINNRRQLPNVPKKPVRQSSMMESSSNREPTPDYDSGGGGVDKELKSPLATSQVKKTDNQNENADATNSGPKLTKQALDNGHNNVTKGKKKKVSGSAALGETSSNQQPPKRKIQPDDFKIVFISSDSSKDSDQLNSSLENNGEFIGEMEYEDEGLKPPVLPQKKRPAPPAPNSNHHRSPKINLNLLYDRMSMSTSGTSIRTAATRDRLSPVMRSPRIERVRNIPVRKAPSMDDRSITELSIHDMQMMHHDASLTMSRSLSESDLSEIIGGATGSGSNSPLHLLAPSDDEEQQGRRPLAGVAGRQQGPLVARSYEGSNVGRRSLPPAPILPSSARLANQQRRISAVAPPVQQHHYNSEGNSSGSSSNSSNYSNHQLVVKRSASINPKKISPVSKPVRRSKSQKYQNFVTSIQHGGSVTLVSLNGDPPERQESAEIKHVHHHHFVQDWDQVQRGYSTLPRKGSKKEVFLKPLASDDSEVVIKKQGLTRVKIRLNNQPEELTSLEPASPCIVEKKAKRKYTLEELEVEGFETSEESSGSSAKNSEFEEEEVDLNSLIEGDVDDDAPLGDIIHDVDSIEISEEEEKMDLGSDPTYSSTTSSSMHRRSSKIVRLEEEDDDLEDFDEIDDFSDLEPELVHLNAHNHHNLSSDTEADFLDSGPKSCDNFSEVSEVTAALVPAAAAAGQRQENGLDQPIVEEVDDDDVECDGQVIEGVQRALQKAPGTKEALEDSVSGGVEAREELKSRENSPKAATTAVAEEDCNISDPVARKKSAVSKLIARFEEQTSAKQPLRSTRSVTPDKVARPPPSPAIPRSKSAAILEHSTEEEDKANEQDNGDQLPLGAEAAAEAATVESKEDLLDEDDEEEMTRRNGAYTSYVLIGAASQHDLETASVHSSSGSVTSANRVVVNVNKGVVLQDGRASNISIVSTESSDLGSPPEVDEEGHQIYEAVPEIPAKIRARNGGIVDQYLFEQPPPRQDYGHRSRGGEAEYEQDPYGGQNLASRRGRPPVIRAAERSRRGHGLYPEEVGEGDIMVEYDEYDNFQITEMQGPNGEHYEVYTDELIDEEDEDYDVRYESEEHSGDEEYVDNQDYPLCQPVQYDSEEYISEGDEYFDREEELRGYNRQIDFTLHTILEESCEDSDASEPRMPSMEQKRSKRHSDPSEMEKYFLYGVGGRGAEDEEDSYTTGTSSPDEVLEDDLQMQYDHGDHHQPQSLMSDQRNTDDSGSVGSESDGQRTPDPKSKKKVVRPKGSRLSSDMSENGSHSEEEEESKSSRSNKKRRGSSEALEAAKQPQQGSPSPKASPPITPLPSQIIEVQPAVESKRASPLASSSEDGLVIRKHKSRDSGFVGSMDDLLRNGSDSSGQGSIPDEKRLEKVSEVSGEDEDGLLERKDSFNNWSSDEDTNLMMNRMRAFFRTFLANNLQKAEKATNPQLAAFEAKLTKMMRTVPGINEDQVKELVEYLSSEETWSNTDSSCGNSDIDLEVYGLNVNNIEDLENGEEIQKESALMYSKLMARLQQEEQQQKRPQIPAEVMAEVSTKLVALMHEVTSASENDEEGHQQPSLTTKKGPPSRRPSKKSIVAAEATSKAEADLSKSAEVLPEVVDVWQGAQRGHEVPHLRRGSLGQVSGSSSASEANLGLNDDERWSWKGSFESTIAMSPKKEEAAPVAPSRVTSARFKPAMVVDNNGSEAERPRNYSTSSLPRLGTSAIKKQPPVTIETSEATLELSSVHKKNNISTSASAIPRSARYRPHGYRPPPTRKPSSPSSRKSSVDSVSRYTDDASDFSSKSGTPSPILGGPRVPHGVAVSRDLVRDFRESSVHSRTSSHGGDEREESIPRDHGDLQQQQQQRHPSPFNRASTSSLGSRSESMASVYSADGGRYGTVNVKGEVEFGLIYNLHTGSLELAIKQCKDLAAVDTKRNRSDPYVKVYLLPDKSKSGKRKTKVKKHTLNPVFDEILKFQMPLDEVERRTLWLTVWHSDMFGRNDFLGEVMLPINTIPLDDPQPRTYSLQDRTEPLSEELALNSSSYRGEIIVALKFVPPNAIASPSKKLGRRNSNSKGTLLILVKEAKNLVSPKGTNIPDPFCKGYLLPEKAKGGKQKTGVCRKTVCPKWEHTMAWDDITLDALWDRSLELTVWDHDRLGHNEILGGVRFNLGTGAFQGRNAAWMDANGGEVTLWQQMLERPNFWVEGSVPLRTAEKLAHA